jgi:hypothetical protein
LGYLEEYGVPGLNPDRPVLKGVTFLPDNFPLNQLEGEGSDEIVSDGQVRIETTKVSEDKNPQANSFDNKLEAAWSLLETNEVIKSSPVGNKSTPQANNYFPSSETKKSHDQIIGSNKDLNKSEIDDLIRNHRFDILRALINTRDEIKINQTQLKYIIEKFLYHGFYIHNGIFLKQEMIDCLKSMQSEMNNNTWKTSDINHRLNTIQNKKLKQLKDKKIKLLRQINKAA